MSGDNFIAEKLAEVFFQLLRVPIKLINYNYDNSGCAYVINVGTHFTMIV